MYRNLTYQLKKVCNIWEMKISYGYEEIYRGNSIGQLTHERCTTSSLVIWELETKTTVKLHTH